MRALQRQRLEESPLLTGSLMKICDGAPVMIIAEIEIAHCNDVTTVDLVFAVVHSFDYPLGDTGARSILSYQRGAACRRGTKTHSPF